MRTGKRPQSAEYGATHDGQAVRWITFSGGNEPHDATISGPTPIDTGGIHMAARRAAGAGGTALQIFTAIPKYYGDKSSIRPERVARFRAALAETGIAPERVIVHAAYVLNTASDDAEKWGRAARGPRQGAGALDGARRRRRVLPSGRRDRRRPAGRRGPRGAGDHPGAGEGAGRTRLLVENTAGAGTTIGRTPDEVGAILAARARGAARAHRLRARHLPPVLGGARHHRIAGGAGAASSTSSRPRPASRRRSST